MHFDLFIMYKENSVDTESVVHPISLFMSQKYLPISLFHGCFHLPRLHSSYYSMQEGHASKEIAVEQVRKGKAWAAVIIGQNLTVDIFKRITDYNKQSVIEGSTIELYVDNTSESPHVQYTTSYTYKYTSV